MREFIYYSKSAVTAGNEIGSDLMKAGRIDIVCQIVIQAFFVSHEMRKDVKLHLVFDGSPYGNRHLVFDFGDVSEDDVAISKKDVAGLIKRMLYKCSEDNDKLVEVFPGCSIERKSFVGVVNELDKQGKNVYLLDKKGEDVRDLKLKGDEVFIIGDQDGFPDDKKKFLKKIDKVSVGPKMLFASQTLCILHNEIDRQETR